MTSRRLGRSGPGLLVRLVLGALVAAVALWYGLDLLFSRHIGQLANDEAMARLEEAARFDRLRFDRVVRSHLIFARLAAGQARAAEAVAAMLRQPPGAVRETSGDPPWLMSRADRRVFPWTDTVLVVDGDSRVRAAVDLTGRPAPPALLALDRRTVALAAEQSLMVMIDGAPYLLSAAAVADTGGTLVLASRLDSNFIAAALGQRVSDRVSLLRGADGMVYASSAPERVPAGALFQPGGAWMTAGKAFFDYGLAEVPMSFMTLVPHSQVDDAVRPLLRMERSQRTMMAAAMSALFLAALALLAFRLRRLTGLVARVTQETFGAEDQDPRHGDELTALQREVERLAAAVVASRGLLKAEAAERIRLVSEQMAVQGEVERLRQLQAVTELLRIGVVVIGEDGPECQNAVMRSLVERYGSVEPFIAAMVQGEDEVHLGDRVFEVSLAREIDPGMLLVHDITERRRAEEAVRSFALFPAQNPHPVLRIDAGGVVVHANDASAPLLEHWGTGTGSRLPGDWRDRIAAVLADGWMQEVEEEVGSQILSLMLVPLAEAGYVNIYGFDVTDRAMAERQLQVLNDWLEQRVAERTRALETAKDAAELASRAKSEFLATVSHELRTPLNAVIGFSEVMASGLFGPLGSERYREYVDAILDSGRHLLDVINDILDVSKIEEGRMELEHEPVEVAEVVAAAVRLVEGRAQAGGLTLEVAVSPAVPVLAADRRRLLQIAVNLLSNAVKFTPAHGTVRIGAAMEGGELVLVVADTGIGMDADEIGVALEPFRQVDSRLARRYEGTGLGLPLARAFTEMHGGRLEIDSAKGRGTTVTVRIPAVAMVRSGAA